MAIIGLHIFTFVADLNALSYHKLEITPAKYFTSRILLRT